MLTLRQIEVIRAIMITGSVGGAARLLNVSSPGISRVMKHAEAMLGLKLFSRKGGRYAPTREASDIFSQINGVYDKVEDLDFVIKRLKRGADLELKIGSVPSISNVMVPRAIADVRGKFPNLMIDVDILKIEEAIDYLLLGKGEAVAVSHKLEHPMLTFEPLARGRLKCIVPQGHPLARRERVSADEIVQYPLIGIDPNDPYGRIMAGIFSSHALVLRGDDPGPLRVHGLRAGDQRARRRHHRRVHARRRQLAGRARHRDRRADGIPDLYRPPQGCDAVELLPATSWRPCAAIWSASWRRRACARPPTSRRAAPPEKSNMRFSQGDFLVIDGT